MPPEPVDDRGEGGGVQGGAACPQAEGGGAVPQAGAGEYEGLEAHGGQEPGAVGLQERLACVTEGRCGQGDPGESGQDEQRVGGGAQRAVSEAGGQHVARGDQGEVAEQAGGVAQFGQETVAVAGGLDAGGDEQGRVHGEGDCEQGAAGAVRPGLPHRLGDDAGGHDRGEAAGRTIPGPVAERAPLHLRAG